jgi:hypothetical protein
MIIRILALDPTPEKGRSDVLCYQVPEHSRECKVLQMLFEAYGIEYTTLASAPRKPRSVKKRRGVQQSEKE